LGWWRDRSYLREVSELPPYAAWRQIGSREGFEVTFFRRDPDGYSAIGQANAVEGTSPWALRYRLDFDETWSTRAAHIASICCGDTSVLEVAAAARGRWLVNREHTSELDGCLDVDLEASAFTNALPVCRMQLGVGQAAEAPAVYVRAHSLGVERLEQTYERLPDAADGTHRYSYAAPAFGFVAELSYDAYGLVVRYPGIAVRRA
jgi:uncharacterized protein